LTIAINGLFEPFWAGADYVSKLDLGSAEVQRRNQAFRFDPSIQYAVEWIEKNAMQFEAQVHYPPMMSVNVPDRRYAWQVEACTNVSQRKVSWP
jgi:hypothetical protein